MKNIVLACQLGMSTSLLVAKMRDAAKEKGIECSIEAFSMSDLERTAQDADIILLGPQVSYNLQHVRQQFPGKKVECIDMVAYGMVDGKRVLNTALAQIG